MTITWYLRSNKHRSPKGEILEDAEKLTEKEALAFMLTAILGDGNAKIINSKGNDEAVIRITMSGEKFDKWEPILDKLQDRFRWHKYPSNAVDEIAFYSSHAIDLARAMISVLPPILRDVLDALGFEKWLNLRRIAEMEVK